MGFQARLEIESLADLDLLQVSFPPDEDTMDMFQLTTLATVAVGTLGLYYFFVASKKIRVYGSNKTQLNFLAGLPIMKEKYFPTFVYMNGVAQTVFGLTKRTVEKPPYTREIFDLADGGQLALDFLLDRDQKDGGTLVILVPGLTNSSHTSYMRTLAMACRDAGTSVVIMNHRGCGGVPLKTDRHYCAANCDDLVEVMTYLQSKFPNKRKVGLGTSLGGIVLSQFLIKHSEAAKKMLDCAFLISIVWNCHTATASIERPFMKPLVNKSLVDALKKFVLKHRKSMESKWDIDDLMKRTNTLREFDENFTTPAFGYANNNEYYDDATVATKISQFPIPVFGLNAADDPMQPGHTLPKREAREAGSNLVLMVTASGGHLGFLEGMFPSHRRLHFMERVVAQFLQHYQQTEAFRQ